MNYTFTIEISKQEHNKFVESNPYSNLLQSAQWAEVKDNWQSMLAGVRNERHELIASSLILIKPLPMGFTMFYIPRGPVLNYEDAELVCFYFQHLRKMAKKQHCLFIKFDPEIHVRDYTLKEKDKPYNENIERIMNNITHAGGKHQGYTTLIEETIQPRFHMGIPRCDNMDAHVPRATFRSKNVAIRKHVDVKLVGKVGLKAFAEVMHMTEERKNVALRDYDYFKKLMEIYGDHAYLFLASVDPKRREHELTAIIRTCKDEIQSPDMGNKRKKKISEELKQAEQELSSMQEILQKYKSETVIAGGLMIGFGKTVEMLYAGMNEDFRTFRPQYLTYMTQFTYAFEHGYDYVTMGGVEGTLEDGLSAFKQSFAPMVNEFIGEFDLPINAIFYKLSKWIYNIRKKKNKG